MIGLASTSCEHRSQEKVKPPIFALEVLSGLNQGEILKIGIEPVVVGGSPVCDIYLAEPTIHAPALLIESRQNVLHLCYLDQQTGMPTREEQRFANDRFCLEGVWFGIIDTVNLSLSRSTRDQAAQFKEVHENQPISASVDSEDEGECKRPLSTAKEGLWYQASKWVWIKSGSIVMSSICLCSLTISIAQGVSSQSPENMYSASAPVESTVVSAYEFPQKRVNETSGIPAHVTEPFQKDQRHFVESDYSALGAYHEDRLAQLNRRLIVMTAERELPTNLKLENEQGTLFLRGSLPDEKRAVLGRMLQRFQAEQGIAEIKNEVKDARHALPFDIVQVTSGPYGNVVTDQGQRLFVGDQSHGYQLVAIQDHQLVFAGKSRITVAW